MATLTSQQLKDSYQSLVTIGDTITTDPTSGVLENGKGNAITDITIQGTTDATLKIDSNRSDIILSEGDTTDENTLIRQQSSLFRIDTVADDFTTATRRFTIDHSSGDISFQDTSNNEAFYWDAAAKRIGIGTNSPAEALHVYNPTANVNVLIESGDTQSYLAFKDSSTTSNASVYLGAIGDEMQFVAGGSEAMRIDSSGNVGIGKTPSALLDVNGDANINGLTVGRGLGNVSTNTAVGSGALSSNTSGDDNTAVGANTLNNNTTGTNNTAVGRNALADNTTGSSNAALGLNALADNTTGNNNTALGINALTSNISGDNNAALGLNALFNNTTGINNTAVGINALSSNTSGSGNIGFGFRTDANSFSPVFNPTTENNRLVAGHTAITNAYVQVAWTVVSDARDKTNIEDVELGLDFVTKLSPKQFQFKKSREDETPNGKKRYGFLAQDILELEGDNPVIIDNEDEDKLKYNGESLVPILVNAIKELKAEIEQLKAQ